MLYWLDKNSEENNVVILSKNSILLGSCNKSSCEHIDSQLKNNTNPVKLLGKKNLSLIPYAKVKKITNRISRTNLTVHFKVDNKTIDKNILFSNLEAKTKCLSLIKKLHGGSLLIKEQRKTVKLEPPQENLLSTLWNYTKNWFRLCKEYSSIATAGITGVVGVIYIISLLVINDNSASLYDAIQAHNLKVNDVTTYLEDGADINFVGTDGVTPLLSALNNGEEKIAIALIEQGANLNISYFGQTALDVAVETSLNNAVLSMLSKNAASNERHSLLIRIIQNELDLKTVKAAIALGAGNINYIDKDGLSVLANALLFEAKTDVVKYLLDNGASTKTNVNGVSPVEFVRSRGKQSLAVLLSQYSS